jgi:preprotein translocase subunit YajC/TolB-like protein
MKRLLPALLLFFIQTFSFAQSADKNDVILKLSGDELTGKVLKIGDDTVEFSYAGETLTYTIKKSEIMKITFASGRIEVFNKQAVTAGGNNAGSSGKGLEAHHNKVAILPFSFVRDGQATDETIGEEVQNECYSYMNKHAGIYTILDPRTTNAVLIKAGINRENIKGYTMEDLCNILGVEYVVEGTVSMNKTTQTTSQSNSGSVSTKSNDKNNNRKGQYNDYSSGTTRQNYQTKLLLSIVNDKGNNVYSQDRTSFWSTQDAYKNTLEYLLKRSPLYTK